MDWADYGVRPTGDRKSRRFEVTSKSGIDIGGKHYAKGDDISQRQALNRKYQKDAGWESRSEYERESQRKDFRNWAKQVASHRDTNTGKVRGSGSDFSKAWVEWKRSNYAKGKSPSGAFAEFLEGIGYRDPGSPYKVGATP
jgi:hypothetical protein